MLRLVPLGPRGVPPATLEEVSWATGDVRAHSRPLALFRTCGSAGARRTTALRSDGLADWPGSDLLYGINGDRRAPGWRVCWAALASAPGAELSTRREPGLRFCAL